MNKGASETAPGHGKDGAAGTGFNRPRASASRASGGLHGLRQHLTREGSAACSTHHGCLRCRPAAPGRPAAFEARPPPSVKPSPLPPSSAAHTPDAHTDCRRRLTIRFHITGDQLQGTVEVARQTDTSQSLTILGWSGRTDASSRRVLTDALRAAAHPDTPVRLPAFAAAARDLFRHTAKTLPPNPSDHPPRNRPSDPCIADTLHAELLAAIDALRTAARHRPRVTITDRAEADRLLPQALSALRELYALFFSYLEHALQPLEPLVTRGAVRAFILETCHELDDLTASHTLGDMYAETLSVTDSSDKLIGLEVDGSLGVSLR